MASSINASTAGAGGVITTADNSGILNLQSGGVTVATINSTGIVMASNTAPAFSAYQSTPQSVTNTTFTKCTFTTEEFDTNSNFASSRFTPTVAGYYQINACITQASGSSTGFFLISMYKNGADYKRGNQITTQASGNVNTASSLFYLNGSTDYVEIYTYQSTGGTINTQEGQQFTWFNGFLARSA